jgi:hypothetical protein
VKEKKPGERKYHTNKRHREMEKVVDKEALKRFRTPSFQEIAEELKRREK